MDKRVEMMLLVVSIPVVVAGSWMLGRYGTVSPCGALDQIFIDAAIDYHAPETAGDFLAMSAVPSLRRSFAATPGRCLSMVWKHEIQDIQHALRWGWY